MKHTTSSRWVCNSKGGRSHPGWRMAAGLAMAALHLSASAQGTAAQTPQTSPDAAHEQRRAQERENVLRGQQERTPDVRLPSSVPASPAAARLPEGESPCFAIATLRLQVIEGDAATPADFDFALDAAAGPGSDDPAVGRCLGTDGIAILIQRLQDAIISRGLVTTRVLAGPQDLRGGVITLTVVPGRIRAIRDAEESDRRGNTRTALPARPGDILNLRDIEQALENLKRVATAEADIQIEAAPADQGTGAPGLSDLVVNYRQPMPFRLSVSLDDSGSRATGRHQGGLTFSYDNALTLSDLFYVSLNHSLEQTTDQPGDHGTQGNTVHYSVPFGYWLLGATASNSRYRQSVAGASQIYLYAGSSSNLDVKLSRLVHRDATRKTTLSLRAFRRSSANFIDDTEIGVQRRVVGGFEAGISHQEFIGTATLDVGLAHKRGTGAFGSLPAPEETFGEGTSRMRITTLDASLGTPFKAMDLQLHYGATLRIQTSQSTLTPRDLFAIGGRYTVRGFDGESSLSAERGLLLRNELGLALGNSGHTAYSALDFGRVTGPSSESLVGKSLAGAALGLRGVWSGLQYDVFIGEPVKRPEFFRTASVTAGFFLNYSF